MLFSWFPMRLAPHSDRARIEGLPPAERHSQTLGKPNPSPCAAWRDWRLVAAAGHALTSFSCKRNVLREDHNTRS